MYDGNSSRSDLLVYGHGFHKIMAVSSSGNAIFVTFSSAVNVDTGFLAKIHKTSSRDLLDTFCTVTNPCKANQGHCDHDQQCHMGLLCGTKNCPHALGYASDTNCCYELCNGWLDLDSGILTSPNYPNMSPASTECAWTISAPEPSQIVEVQFVDFEVSSIMKLVTI